MVVSRSKGKKKKKKQGLTAEECASRTKRALCNPDEQELQSFVDYLGKRQAKRRRVDWTDRAPKTESEVEWYVLDNYHFCHNFREDDPTTGKFKAAVAKIHDGFLLWCCAVVHAVLPNWRWYELLVKTACGSLVVNPEKLTANRVDTLAGKLTDTVDRWMAQNNGEPFWTPMPYITLASEKKQASRGS
jgi:hypothetical protein